MKAIRTISLILLCLATFFNLQAQQPIVNFEYDDAGNRTGRYVTVVKSTEADSLFFEAELNLTTSGLQAKVYPNPTYGIINIEIDGAESIPVNYTLTDQQARLIMEGRLLSNAETISLLSLEPGVYFLRLHNTERKLVYKIIKQ